MAGEFMIYARGCWREVSTETGRIYGLRGRTRFLYIKSGRLEVASTASVLGGLRSLAAGQVTTVRLGPAVLNKRKKKKSYKSRHRCRCRHHCNTNNRIIKNETRKCADEAKKPPQRADVAVQTSQVSEPYPLTTKERKKKDDTQAEIKSQKVSSQVAEPVSLTTKETQTPIKSTESQKEFTFKGEDVKIYRRFLSKTDPDFDQRRFTTDRSYTMRTLYGIQPVVVLQRCRQITRMLRKSFSSHETMSLKDFAMKLGLQSVSNQKSEQKKKYKMRQRAKKSVDSSTQIMEEKSVVQERNRVPTKKADEKKLKKCLVEVAHKNIMKMNSNRVLETPESDAELKSQQILVSKSQPVKCTRPGFRDYTSLEDHAIVSWISNGDRASRVNGNTVWKELERQFMNITGGERSWHSLRNRYLRYILPSLGALALPQPLVRRLRAAAAKGQEMKNRKPSPYPFEAPRVRSAWGARPQTRDSPSLTPSMTDTERNPSPLRRKTPTPEHHPNIPTKKASTPKIKNPTTPSKPVIRRKSSARIIESSSNSESSQSSSDSELSEMDKHGSFKSRKDGAARRSQRESKPSSQNENYIHRVLRSSNDCEPEPKKRPRTRLYNPNADFQ